MNLLLHNLKVAFRNLMKYKLQTAISVVSIAIGIVTLAFVHSALKNMQVSSVYDKPYRDRAYNLSFATLNGEKNTYLNREILRAVKRDGGPQSAEQIAIATSGRIGLDVEFHLPDSTVRKGSTSADFIDPEYIRYAGFYSAITGKKIEKLKKGEAIIGEKLAKEFFGDKNPVGTVQILTGPTQPIQVTIVDVFQPLSSYDKQTGKDTFYFCLADCIEDQELDLFFLTPWINIVLKEGCREQQLLEELNKRVTPLGVEALLSKAINEKELKTYVTAKLIIYIVSSLILLAAIIGFLRIQIQLFHIRRRELALRIVNGATLMRLFSLLITEIAISIILSVIISIWLGYLLQDFLFKKLDILLQGSGFILRDLWPYSIAIGGFLIVLCSMIAWITIRQICRNDKGLAANMRRSRNHLFRNLMLGLQITISIIFVSCTFIIVKGGNEMMKRQNIPGNEDFYEECIHLQTRYSENPARLVEELQRLPELEKMVMCSTTGYNTIKEINGNPEILEKLNNHNVFKFHFTNDTTMLSLLGIEVEWFRQDIDHNECLLLNENLYATLKEVGLLEKNTLTIEGVLGISNSITLPIAGIVRNIPYSMDNDKAGIGITSYCETVPMEYFLVPKAGKSKALAQNVSATIELLEPENINKMTFNFRIMLMTNFIPIVVETARAAGLILGGISLIICAMSIFSTILLDTRSRKKEVAIRKVNGAKSRDIYKMFGRVYIILIVFSLFIAVPVCLMFNHLVEKSLTGVAADNTLSPVWPIVLGISVVSLVIFLIVGCQTYRMLQIDPAKIIAKE